MSNLLFCNTVATGEPVHTALKKDDTRVNILSESVLQLSISDSKVK